MEKLNQVMLYVDDVEKAKAFWTETLEFVVVSETPLAEAMLQLKYHLPKMLKRH
ncbi:glyoxalase/bleomycin resistance protein/dioxygenase superfamily protein [Staphylococcus aureus]|nr:glyoxalase/bleomycin resistance protein/dioxygenase superfamily protein [Staphylococcus aureus]